MAMQLNSRFSNPPAAKQPNPAAASTGAKSGGATASTTQASTASRRPPFFSWTKPSAPEASAPVSEVQSEPPAKTFDENQAGTPVTGIDNRYVAMTIYGPIVAALAHEPDFHSLSSPDSQVKSIAGQTAHKLMGAAARAVNVMRQAGADPLEASRVANRVTAEAWSAGQSVDKTVDDLGVYTARLLAIAREHSIANPIIGHPSLKEIGRREQGADGFMKIQAGARAMIPSTDDGLVDWFIDEVRGDDIASIVAGMNAADDFLKGEVSIAFMGENARMIVRLAAAAALSHADCIHQRFTAQTGEKFTTAIMGTRENSLSMAKKSIVSTAINAVDELPIAPGGLPAEISIAQAMGTLIKESGRPWLNSRIAMVKAAWNCVPEDRRKNGIIDPAFDFTQDYMDKVRTQKEPIVTQALETRSLILSVIGDIKNPDEASTRIKTRSALVLGGVRVADDLVAVERAITAAADACLKPVELSKRGVPVLPVNNNQNQGLSWMTVHSTLREVAGASVRAQVRKTGKSSPEVTIHELILSMDGMSTLTGVAMTDLKEDMERSVQTAQDDLVTDQVRDDFPGQEG